MDWLPYSHKKSRTLGILLFTVRKDAALPAEDLSVPYGYDNSPQQGHYVPPLVFIVLLGIVRSGMKYSYQ